MLRMPQRTAFAVAVLLTALGALTACAPGTPTATDPSPSASASPSPSPSPSESEPAAITAPPCTRDGLDVVYTATDGTAGQMHGVLRFENTSGAACSMSGYPVVFFDHYEVAITMGPQATTDEFDPPLPFDLAPGAFAMANVTITQAGNVDGCSIVTTNALLVAPPTTHPVTADTPLRWVPAPGLSACDNDDIGLITVGGVVPAS